MSDILKNNMLNRWGLFWLFTGPITISILFLMSQKDLGVADGVSDMIQVAVRCAVPFLFLVFATSALQTLFPGPVSNWLLCNRSYIGLCFAAAMAWQGFFIMWLVTLHSGYYINEVYVMRDAIEGVISYTLLFAMTVTSFSFGKKLLSARNWKRLHTFGIYFLWAYAFVAYWWGLFVYSNPPLLEYVYYAMGFTAWVLRAGAWNKRRANAAERRGEPIQAQPVLRFAGMVTVTIGLIAGGIGSSWYPALHNILTGYSFTRVPELYLPYWPFEPFLPLLIIGLGFFMLTRSGNTVADRHAPEAVTTT